MALSIIVFISYRTVSEVTDHHPVSFLVFPPVSAVTARPISVWKDLSDGSTWEFAVGAAARAVPPSLLA